jgi:NAD(P)-dependent dehydrogenase (short-subunit alcohol dehydrogenase family)
MASTSPVVLILGAGANIGQHVARAFAAKGYKVALTSRKANPSEDTPNEIHIAADLSNPSSVSDVFSKVKSSFDVPSVVVYNGE